MVFACPFAFSFCVMAVIALTTLDNSTHFSDRLACEPSPLALMETMCHEDGLFGLRWSHVADVIKRNVFGAGIRRCFRICACVV